MSCDAPVQTGRPLGSAIGGSTATTRSASGVLFDQSNADMFSRNVVINPGMTARISAFFPSDSTVGAVKVNRLVMSTAEMPQAQACAPCPPGHVSPVGPLIPLTERQEMTNGIPWQLTADSNTLLINVPGTYRLELSTEELAGSMYVEYDMFPNTLVMSPIFAGGGS